MSFFKRTTKDRVITFTPDSPRAENILDYPSPASKNTPQWFKTLSKYVIQDVKCSRYPDKNSSPNNTNFTVKACKPFLDSLLTGYMITLPTDVHAVRPEDYDGRMIWDSNTNMVENHAAQQMAGLEVPEEYEPAPYKWNLHWGITLPKGYSLLYTHPLNRIELPFYTMSGVVDSDSYGLPVNLPFFLRKDFFGLIPRGTPIAQVIPVKREEWTHEVTTFDDFDQYESERLKLFMGGAYKRMNWVPKKYR